jgi:hypothetical protein
MAVVQMMDDFGFASHQSTIHCKNPKAKHQLIIIYKNYTDHVEKGVAWPSKPVFSLWFTAWYVCCTVILVKHSIYISYSFTSNELSVRATTKATTNTCSCHKWMKQSDYNYWLLMVNLEFNRSRSNRKLCQTQKIWCECNLHHRLQKKETLLLTK